MRWRCPVLEVDYSEDRDLFCGAASRSYPRTSAGAARSHWPTPVSHPSSPTRCATKPRRTTDTAGAREPRALLSALLGTTRAVVLRAATAGATTAELARAAGVSEAAASC